MVGAQANRNPLIGPLGHVLRTRFVSRFSSQTAVFFIAKFNRPDMEVIRELLEAGEIKSAIERVYPFAQIAEALRVMGEGHAAAKLVVKL